MTTRYEIYSDSLLNLGFAQGAHYVVSRLQNALWSPRRPFALYSKYAKAPLWCRPGTSDLYVFDQIFRFREYRCLDHIREAGLIIDCGANVGFSSAYFLTKFPMAFVVAVEPDYENCQMLEHNLAPYGGRFSVIRSGIWSHACGLVMSETPFMDGREWARTVRPSLPDEMPTMIATDIETILRQYRFERISILKIDIEGAERYLFDQGPPSWLALVDNLVIELHGEDCSQIFREAIKGQDFVVSSCDELTVCLRPT